jgi:hypothetical protein
MPAIDTSIGQVVVTDLDLGIDGLPQMLIGPQEVLDAPPHDLHVLLRHRPPSIHPRLSVKGPRILSRFLTDLAASLASGPTLAEHSTQPWWAP